MEAARIIESERTARVMVAKQMIHSLPTAEERICVLEERFKNVNKAGLEREREMRTPKETEQNGESRVERVFKAMAGDRPNSIGR